MTKLGDEEIAAVRDLHSQGGFNGGTGLIRAVVGDLLGHVAWLQGWRDRWRRAASTEATRHSNARARVASLEAEVRGGIQQRNFLWAERKAVKEALFKAEAEVLRLREFVGQVAACGHADPHIPEVCMPCEATALLTTPSAPTSGQGARSFADIVEAVGPLPTTGLAGGTSGQGAAATCAGTCNGKGCDGEAGFHCEVCCDLPDDEDTGAPAAQPATETCGTCQGRKIYTLIVGRKRHTMPCPKCKGRGTTPRKEGPR